MKVNTYLVAFTLEDKSNSILEEVYKVLKMYSGWAKISDYVWIVISRRDHGEIRDDVRNAIDEHTNGTVAVFDITNTDWATSAIPKEVTAWMHNNI